MDFAELKDKALSLPAVPGVYIMRDKSGNVIYVGKAKKLKNRVSQYFQDSVSHSTKTLAMVSKIHQFDVIVAASEFEALVLECSLIKRYLPKYNILLKDDKGYPYVRINMREPYPCITLVNKIADDNAEYFGPYGSRRITHEVIEAIVKTLKLPDCSKQFPRDIGKGRPCLNYHMKQCDGWCTERKTCTEYRQVMEQARYLLQGNFKQVAESIRQQMLVASDNLEFELAASLRDRLNAVEALGKKQLVTAGSLADTDVIGYGETEAKACFAILHFRNGNLLDKEYEVFTKPEDKEEAVSSLLKQYYLSRGLVPKQILLPFFLEEAMLMEQLFEQQLARRVKMKVPQRGDSARLKELANKNAYEEAQRATGQEDRVDAVMNLLAKMLSIATLNRIESYDISNIAGTDIVAGMVVYECGKPKRSQYKRFKIENLENQDDYASMRQVIKRRFVRYLAQDNGFSTKPDLLLIDGGINHSKVVEEVLRELNLQIPVFGMVKDDRHRTRGLVTANGEEIRIDNNQAVFSMIGNIQEETHRFAIEYHRKLRSKRLRYSELDEIPGIGPKRKEELLKKYKSLTDIRGASLLELERHLPKNAAIAVYSHFHPENNREDKECE